MTRTMNAASATRGADTGAAGVPLRLSGLTVQYPGVDCPAVDALDLDVESGRFLSLLGPSGCGKTTTLRMVAGLQNPTSGSIELGGRDITRVPVYRRGMGMVFQSYALFPHMDVTSNVAFGLQMRRVGKKEARQRALDALRMVQMEHLGHRRTTELSGGQQQRVALARALVVEPDLLLLDEPLSNLDAKLRESMRAEIRQIQRRLGTTTLFVTHDQQEALETSDLIAVMNEGRLEQLGRPEDVFERPETLFVATFIGQANLFPVEVSGGAGGTREVTYLGHRFTATTPSAPIGREAIVMVRPHHVSLLDRSGPAPADGPELGGVVADWSYTGDTVMVTVMVGERLIQAAAPATPSARFAVGDEVWVSWAPGSAHLIAASSAEEVRACR